MWHTSEQVVLDLEVEASDVPAEEAVRGRESTVARTWCSAQLAGSRRSPAPAAWNSASVTVWASWNTVESTTPSVSAPSLYGVLALKWWFVGRHSYAFDEDTRTFSSRPEHSWPSHGLLAARRPLSTELGR